MSANIKLQIKNYLLFRWPRRRTHLPKCNPTVSNPNFKREFVLQQHKRSISFIMAVTEREKGAVKYTKKAKKGDKKETVVSLAAKSVVTSFTCVFCFLFFLFWIRPSLSLISSKERSVSGPVFMCTLLIRTSVSCQF